MRDPALVATLRARLEGTSGELHVVAPSARAAKVLAATALAPGEARLGVAFTTWNGLAKTLLRRIGLLAPREDDASIERARLVLALRAAGPGPFAEVLALPASLPTLIEAWHEAGRADPRATPMLSADAQALLALPRPPSAARELCEVLLREPARGKALRGIGVLVIGSLPPDGVHACLRHVLEVAGVALEHQPYARETGATRELWCAPDPANEARLAARLCSSAHARGIPFARMVVVAPQLGPYVPHLHAAFAAERVPFVAQARSPLGQEPRGALLVHAARMCFGAAPRVAFLALLGSPLARTPLSSGALAALEIAARETAAKGRGAATAELAAALPAVRHELARAERLAEFLAQHAKPAVAGTRDERVAEAIDGVLTTLATLERLRPDLGDEAFVTELEELVAAHGLPLASEGADTGFETVHVVEPDQALAFPAEHLHLMGLSANQVPGAPPDETWLRDTDRHELGLPKRDLLREREEALLLACLLHATTSVIVSRPGRDPGGRETEPSLWHARLWNRALGASGAAAERPLPVGLERIVPLHPATAAERRIEAGECPADLALTALALERAEPEAIAALLPAGRGAIAAQARALEDFRPGDLARDGVLGPSVLQAPEASISVSALQVLAGCPQRFWLQHALKIAPLPEPPDPMALPRDRSGNAVHAALSATFEHFAKELGATADPRQLVEPVVAFARTKLGETLREHCGPALTSLPELLHVLGEEWQTAIERTLRSELAWLHEHGAKVRAVEEVVRGVLRVRRVGAEHEHALALHGRVDRIDTIGADGLGVVDFKTGTNAEAAANVGQMLRGRQLQLVTYGMLLEAAARDGRNITSLAAVAVGPAVEPDAEFRTEVEDPLGLLHGELARDLHDTLATLQEVRLAGTFAMRPDREECKTCDWSLACRRLHPPSLARVEASGIAELERCAGVATKKASKGKP